MKNIVMHKKPKIKKYMFITEIENKCQIFKTELQIQLYEVIIV